MSIYYMELAIQSAREGIINNEGGPFGACIVDSNGNIIAVSHNTVIKENDCTCHAEMNCIRVACRQLKTYILDNCELYTTAEPCPMCLAAIYWARIKKIYIGVDQSCAARYGFDDAYFYEQIALPEKERTVSSETAILSTECEKVFIEWQELNRPLY